MKGDRTGEELDDPQASYPPLPALWLCGAPGAGKSVVAWELFHKRTDEQIAYVDIDQLKMMAPDAGETLDLAAASLTALVDAHRNIGTQALLVSGVIDPEQTTILEAALRGRAEVTWILLDADDDTLGERIRQRGWPEDLVEMVIAEARDWRAVPDIPRISTSASTPSEAAKAADDFLALRSKTAPSPRTRAEGTDVSDLVVIYGPRAVGKSAISWGLFMDCVNQGEQTGYLDADQLGFIHASPEVRDRLIRVAVESIAHTFREAGASRSIMNGKLSEALVSAWGGAGAALVHLDAPIATLAERAEARHGGDAARLAGDDLEGASSDDRALVLEQAQHQISAYASARVPAHVLDVSDDDGARHASTIRDALRGERACSQ